MIFSEKVFLILSQGESLESIGTNNWAFPKDKVEIVLHACLEQKIGIFGGDVLFIKNRKFEYSYDSWSCEPDAQEPKDEFVLRSITRARSYIAAYKIKGAFFSFVLNDENIERLRESDDFKRRFGF
jgi:hypothetical protein